MAFKPVHTSFDEGVKRIEGALRKLKATDPRKRIVTSQDEVIQALSKELRGSRESVPEGFVKWQAPVYFESGAHIFFSVASPNAEVDKHVHEIGDALRIIVQGSIVYNGKTLLPGDWMWIPEGKRYSMQAGPTGSIMCYCYSCCCVTT